MTSQGEKLYKAIKGSGAMTLAMGIVVMVTGIASGVLLIIQGAKLLAHRKDIII